VVTGPLEPFVGVLREAFERAGFAPGAHDDPDLSIVVNVVDEQPRPFRRRSRGTFVAALRQSDRPPAIEETYPVLVRALANVVLTMVPGSGVWLTTMERGHARIAGPGDGGAVVRRLLPLAGARLVIDNEFRDDLEPELWGGDEVTAELGAAGRRLDDLGLLPSPFPIEDLLDERDLRHVKRLYGIGGLSYGNLSQREDAQRFWMSASGVDKSRLKTPGTDVLLVTGYDAEHGRMILSVPPAIEPRRVSVDAIEHWMIYEAHPQVGAILHVHAWVEGVPATEIAFPCGSEELARAVAELVAWAPDPGRAIVGLRNHGITATGSSLTEILDRIESRVLPQVPMA
jgi:ribulose-5-phosphate 4-epimerase/fuculose-1-phosphate aldolase